MKDEPATGRARRADDPGRTPGWALLHPAISLERDDFSSSRHPALSFCLSMISAQTLRVCREGKPVPTFPDQALIEFRDGHGSRGGDLTEPRSRPSMPKGAA